MKKLGFYGILILVFLAACSPPDPEEAAIPAGASDQNMTKITVYLDGYEPPEQSRAINKVIAMMSCDYFEVVFVGNDGTSTPVVARGQWRIGERAGVNGVYRTAGGVDYGGVSPNPGPSAGSALLLAGKADKTLMAIGKLSADTSLIKDDTKFVTFEVAAFKAGISESSFLTAAKGTPPSDFGQVGTGNTDIDNNYSIAGISFQAFRLPTSSPDIKATYEFKLDASSVSFATYKAGLFVSGNGGVPYKKRPSYTMANGSNITSTTAVPSLDIRDERTVVTMINNQSGAFEPVVQFKFSTSQAIVGSVFALVFQIPIYALVPECVWYVRPGYGVLNYELDDGGGMGGAVLIKIGDATEPPMGSNEFKIKIMHPPAKWRYRWKAGESNDVPKINPLTTGDNGNPEAEYDRIFRIGPITANGDGSIGLEVQKFDMSDHDLNHFNNGAYVGDGGETNVIPYDLLTFIIGEKELPSNAPGNYILPDTFYGLVEVTVKHTNPELISATDKFFILVSGNYYYTPATNESNYLRTSHYDYASLNGLNRTLTDNIPVTSATTSPGDFNGAFNTNDPPNSIHIVRLGASFDIPSMTIQTNAGTPGDSRLYMFVSVVTNDNLVLGRGGSGSNGNSITVSGDNSGLSAFFFGKWPFEGLKHSPTELNGTTKNFIVNAGGSYVNPTAITINNSRKMITDGASLGGIYNVDLGNGVTVNNVNMLH